jgi:tRNA dimethylallyltransferase
MAVASIAIVGPTACGKTRRAVAVASRLGGEILSADSRQIYRGMTIGTGKDLEEYGDIPYHLIDICDAGEKYNLYKYLKEFRKAYDEVLSRSRVPVICGGSGMYVENAVKGILMPEVPENKVLREFLQGKNLDELAEILSGYKTLHNTTDIDNCKRAVRAIEIQEYYRRHPEEARGIGNGESKSLDCIVIGVDIPRNIRRERISARLRQRLDAGMIDEVRSIIDGGVDADDLIYYGLEYKYVTLHVVGRISYDEMFHDLEIAIHQFAKRQMTWFRGMETRGTKINWLPYDLSDDEFVDRVEELFFAG